MKTMWMVKRNSCAALLCCFLIACGSSSSNTTSATTGTPTTTSTASTIDELPRATSPVSASTSGSLAAKTASTGAVLNTLGSSTYGARDSMAMCENAQIFGEAVHVASLVDSVICAIQKVFSSSTDIYDGAYHAYNLSFSGSASGGDSGSRTGHALQSDLEKEGSGSGSGRPDHVKFKIVRNTGGAITEFEMFECSGGSQKGYIHQTINATTGAFVMLMKKIFSSSESARLDVTGTLSNGSFTGTKEIIMTHSSTTQWGVMTVDQTSGAVSLNGYRSGTFGTSSNTERLLADAQLIDTNTNASSYDPSLLALGDGCARAILSFKNTLDTNSATNTLSFDFTQCWNGDTYDVDNSSTGTGANYIAAVTGVTPAAAVSTAPVIAFDASAGETYACTDTATTATPGQDAITCFSHVPGNSVADCHGITGIDSTNRH